MNGGFSGNISNLWYFNYSLGTTEIQKLVRDGPNTTPVNSTSSTNNKDSSYLSLRWFFNDSGDLYNPVSKQIN